MFIFAVDEAINPDTIINGLRPDAQRNTQADQPNAATGERSFLRGGILFVYGLCRAARL
jgi:hypothetical protein